MTKITDAPITPNISAVELIDGIGGTDVGKVEITDEMIERAGEFWKPHKDYVMDGGFKRRVRSSLEAALNPPPETVVTNEMMEAGVAIKQDARVFGYTQHCRYVADIYRAMFAARPKECKQYGPTEHPDRTFEHHRRSDISLPFKHGRRGDH